jgi:hypothetical protein
LGAFHFKVLCQDFSQLRLLEVVMVFPE